tara:strand:+ start:1787 stop:2461 length:675 start_codon:yes stop_codon:yes gene_type:complete
VESNIKNYIVSSSKNKLEYYLSDVLVLVKDPLPENVDLDSVLHKVKTLFRNKRDIINLIDVMYIGHFKEFEQYKINAYYDSGAIYVTNDQKNEKDMIDDIIHEYAHALEHAHGEIIYEDETLDKEFLNKRLNLEKRILYDYPEAAKYNFFSTEYDKELDNFFFNDVGYDKLNRYINGLFLDSYSTTSVNEYFATAFEHYFLTDQREIKKICPKAFSIINYVCNY